MSDFRRKTFIRIFVPIILLLGVFSLSLNSGHAAIRKEFNYQGKLTDASGLAVADGMYDIAFNIYTQAGGGSAAWTENWKAANLFTDSGTAITNDGCASGVDKIVYTLDTNETTLAAGQTLWNTSRKQSAVIESVNTSSNYICVYDSAGIWASGEQVTNRIYVKNGLFSVMVGSVTPQTIIFTGSYYYLGVAVGSDAEMVPRKKIGAVPQAWNANSLTGDGNIDIDNTSVSQDGANINYNPASGNYNAFSLIYGSAGGTGTALSVLQQGAGNIVDISNGSGSVLSILNNGNVGIGIADPGVDRLSVYQNTPMDLSATFYNAYSGYGSYIANKANSNYVGNVLTSPTASWVFGLFGNTSFSIYDNTDGKRPFTIAQNAPSDSFYINSSGNVGIGTNSPSSKLDIAAGNLDLDNTTYNSGSQYGIITKNGTRFIHDFNYGNNGAVTTDGYNTFVGLFSGNLSMGSTATSAIQASSNAGFGYSALYFDTTGYGNSALGRAALYSNTTGFYNIALGLNAGRYITDGSTANQTSNTSLYLGSNTKALADGDANEIVIGNNAVGLGSNTAVLGNSSITTTALRGNVGIGTTSPSAKLSILGGEGTYAAPNFGSSNLGSINILSTTSDRRNGITFSSAGSSNAQAGIYVHQDASAGTHMYLATTNSYTTGPQARITILNNGDVGIGTTSPSAKLDINGGSIRTTGQLISTAASGAPLSVTSNTLVSNLNADLLDGTSLENIVSKSPDLSLGQYNQYYYMQFGTITIPSGQSSFSNTWIILIQGYEIAPDYQKMGIIKLSLRRDTLDNATYSLYVSNSGTRKIDPIYCTSDDGVTYKLYYKVEAKTSYSGFYKFKVLQGRNILAAGTHIDTDTAPTGTKYTWTATESGTIGTSNYIPKFNSSGGLSDSLIYDSGTGIGIGTTAPSAKLDISGGNLNLDNTTNSNQYGILTKNGTRFIHDFNYGNNGTVTTEGYNIFIGSSSGNLTMGSGATQTYQASYNTAVGKTSLSANTIGYYNSALGVSALYYNTTGYSNSAVGVYALYANTTGYDNSALGVGAGRYIADGATANQASNTSLYLGSNTKALADGDTNEIIIGYNTTGLGSNTAVLGNSSITTTALRGNVGIGTTSPTYHLDIRGGSAAGNILYVEGNNFSNGTGTTLAFTGSSYQGNLVIKSGSISDSNAGINLINDYTTDRRFSLFIDAADSKKLKINTDTTNSLTGFAGTNLLTIDTSGNVGIGTTSPTAVLHLKSGTASAGTAPLKFTSGINLTIPEAGVIEYDGTGLYFTPSTVRKIIAFTESNITGTASNVTGVVAAANGGTGQDSSSWSGIPHAVSGAWSAMTGTANYVTRWTDANTLGAGALYDNGTSVGVGTASPSATLHVAGNSIITGVANFTGSVAIDTNPDNNSSGFEYGNGYDPLLSNYYNERFRVNSFFETPQVSLGVASNYLLRSEEFDISTWVKTGIGTVTSNSVRCPTGATSAENIPAGSDAAANVAQTVTNSTTGYWSAGIWARAQSGTATISLEIDSSAETGTPKEVTLDTTWRFFGVKQNFTAAHTTKTFKIISGTNAISLWGARLNAGETVNAYYATSSSNLASQSVGAFFNNTIIYGSLSGNASTSTYSTRGIFGTLSLSDTADKTGKWEVVGYVALTFNSTYGYGQSFNYEINLKEHSDNNTELPQEKYEDITLKLRGSLDSVAGNSTTFNTTVPNFSVEIAGDTELTSGDVAALVYSTSTSSKIIRVYVKLPHPNTSYEVNPMNAVGFSYNSAAAASTSTSYLSFTPYNGAVITALPTPAQGSITYGVIRDSIFRANVGIGTASPSAKLDISAGNLDLDNTTNANQYGIITKDGTRFIHDFNYGNNGTVTTSGANTFIGLNSGNLTMGSGATQAYEASSNTAVGNSAFSSNTLGYYNAAFGASALISNTTGYHNSAIGYTALYANTTGYWNSASGTYALYSNTTGYSNSAFGRSALYSNTTGYSNSALGADAGRYISGGTISNQISNTSLYLGTNTKALADGDANEIIIGYDATGLGSNTAVLGNSSIITTALRGNVGIGTTSPTYHLDIRGGNAAANILYAEGNNLSNGTGTTLAFTGSSGQGNLAIKSGSFSADSNAGINLINDYTTDRRFSLFIDAADSKKLKINTDTTNSLTGFASTNLLAIDTSGNVGIGTESPATKLDIKDSSSANANGQNILVLESVYDGATIGSGGRIVFRHNVDNREAADIRGYTFGGSSSGLAFGTGWDAVTPKMVITNSGNIGIGTTSPAQKLSVTAGTIGLSDTYGINWSNGSSSIMGLGSTGGYSLQFNTFNGSANTEKIRITGAGNVGIGTTSPTSQLTMKSTSAYESATLGSELLSSSGWTTTGWTGDFSSGFTHTVGDTTALSNSIAATSGNLYQVAFTVTGRTAGSFTVAFGGVSSSYTATGNFGPKAVSTGSFSITPTSDFDGTIIVSIKQITSSYGASYAIQDNTGANTFEIRSSLAPLSNSFIGKNAGAYNTTGYSNSAVGVNALLSNTTGYSNSAVGLGSLDSNVTGYQNSAVGKGSLGSNVIGNSNSAFGVDSLRGNVSGYSNSAFGVNSLMNNTTGNSNTALGVNALASNTTGGSNSALGFNAGHYITDGSTVNQTSSTSLYLGANTKALADGVSNEIVIGYNAIGLGSNTVVLGNSSIATTILRGTVGIGTEAPNSSYKLDVSGSIHGTDYYSSDGSAGISTTINVRKADDSGTCTITVKNGLITATDCP